MKFRWSNFSLLFLCISLALSCDSDDEKIVCLLSSVKTGDVTEEYIYNSENKIEALLIHSDEGEAKANLEYNDKGQFIKMESFDVSEPEEFDTYELVYDNNNNPQKLNYWSPEKDLSGPPQSVLTFYHDGRNRLIKLEISYDGVVWHSRRFEYDIRGNVNKIFFSYQEEEFLGVENLSFDNKPKYYGLTPELETLSVYIRFFQPGKNNPLTARIYADANSQAVAMTYAVGYDENGLIASNKASTSSSGNNPEFEVATYNCQL